MDIYSKERLEQVMNDMKTKVLPQIKSEIEKRAKKNIGIHNEATCSTTAGTAAKAVIAPSGFELSAGATIIVTFTNAISVTNATLTFVTAVDDTAEDYAEKNPATEGWYVLSSGDFTPTQDTEPQSGTTYYIVSAAKPIYYRGAALPANLVKAGMSLIMRYNGTQWDIISNIEALDDYLQVNAQNFSNSQKQQARTNIDAQENVTDMAKLGCGIGTCSTDSGTALVVSLTDYELVKNGHVSVNFEHDVPAGATLNINGKGAKPIIYKGAAIEADTIKADDTVMFAYDGTNYVVTSLGGETGGGSDKEIISIHLKAQDNISLVGCSVTVTNTTTQTTIYSGTWDDADILVAIDAGVTYSISVSAKAGLLTPSAQSYTAVGGNVRNLKFTYLTALGVYIEDVNHILYTASEWSTASHAAANAIVLATSTHKFRICTPPSTYLNWVNYNDDVQDSPVDQYVTKYPEQANAIADYDYVKNTQDIIRWSKAVGYTDKTKYAGAVIENYKFPDGTTDGYYAALGHLILIYNNMTAMNACMYALYGNDAKFGERSQLDPHNFNYQYTVSSTFGDVFNSAHDGTGSAPAGTAVVARGFWRINFGANSLNLSREAVPLHRCSPIIIGSF